MGQENIKFEKDNDKMKDQQEQMPKIIKLYKKTLPKSSIRRHGLPAELMNELFASMPLGNAFELLAKMPNGLLAILARNVQKMINDIKEGMKKNKLNSADSGTKLSISEDGLIAKHYGPYGRNSIRAVLPIPSFNFNDILERIIGFYYEVQIVNGSYVIAIGFCEQFPLEDEMLGQENNSIGFSSRNGVIWIDGSWNILDNVHDFEHFKKGDFVGIGIIHQPNSQMECFATLNGQWLYFR